MISPITDQLANGTMYWDQIGPQWYRLLDRSADLRVVGSYRAEFGFGGAVRYRATILNPEQNREFQTIGEARLWIESAAVSPEVNREA